MTLMRQTRSGSPMLPSSLEKNLGMSECISLRDEHEAKGEETE